MSSRSNGVTKVVLILTMISWVTSSPASSASLTRAASAWRPAGSVATSLASSSAATAMFSAARVNSG